jgi:hypothetical protein
VSRETERAALAAHFLSVWLESDGPIAWPNKPFTTPSGHMFAVYSIVSRGSVRMSLGRSFFKRHFNTLQVDIYTPQDLGTKRSREISDRLEDIYDSLVLVTPDGESLKFSTPTGRVLDPNVIRASNLDDNWDRFVFEAPYHRDQLVEK